MVVKVEVSHTEMKQQESKREEGRGDRRGQRRFINHKTLLKGTSVRGSPARKTNGQRMKFNVTQITNRTLCFYNDVGKISFDSAHVKIKEYDNVSLQPGLKRNINFSSSPTLFVFIH